MANQEHLDILKQSLETWNQWRKEHTDIQPDLSGADLHEADLHGAKLIDADLRGANLNGAHLERAYLKAAHLEAAHLEAAHLEAADLSDAHLEGAHLSGAHLGRAHLNRAYLYKAHLSGADLHEADLHSAKLIGTDLSRAILREAYLWGADLSDAQLNEADLSGANLSRAVLVGTNLTGAILTQCSIYGISVWNVQLAGAKQSSLVITQAGEPTITVDNLKIAQFIYLLLNNAEIREVIDTITSKVVLILGRFTPERKAVLDALRDELRKQNYSPVLFDFARSENRDITETISLLARMARFVLADITDARSIPQELAVIVPDLPSVPIQPLILESQQEYGMFEHFTRFPWVLPTYRYNDITTLLTTMKEYVIDPAERKAQEVTKR